MNQPTVINGYLHGTKSKYPLSLSSPSWLQWLKVNKKFRIQTELGTVSVYKVDGLWVVQKRIQGKLRQKRLGPSAKVCNLDPNFLNAIARILFSN